MGKEVSKFRHKYRVHIDGFVLWAEYARRQAVSMEHQNPPEGRRKLVPEPVLIQVVVREYTVSEKRRDATRRLFLQVSCKASCEDVRFEIYRNINQCEYIVIVNIQRKINEYSQCTHTFARTCYQSWYRANVNGGIGGEYGITKSW